MPVSTNVSQVRSAQLQAEGWTRRFTALGRRLNEAAELYNELGYEVRLEPVNQDEEETAGAEGCKDCFVTMQARTIYTRPKE
jgi:mRNA-degrading endonuclease YafQ of YafQ-DinJ toxin-antitoxin module